MVVFFRYKVISFPKNAQSLNLGILTSLREFVTTQYPSKK